MSRRAAVSSGLLLYRRTGDAVEVFLAHPGGPFWANRDAGAWTIPKGIVDEGEELLDAACREFEEETGIRPQPPFRSLGSIRQRAGKTVHGWAWEGDADPQMITSNSTEMEWPRGSGQQLKFPEVDRCAWFTPAEVRVRINPAQIAFLDRLEAFLAG